MNCRVKFGNFFLRAPLMYQSCCLVPAGCQGKLGKLRKNQLTKPHKQFILSLGRSFLVLNNLETGILKGSRSNPALSSLWSPMCRLDSLGLDDMLPRGCKRFRDQTFILKYSLHVTRMSNINGKRLSLD